MSVHLVGAGPGDPELITVRGLALLRACDAVVYDDLVSPELVAEAPAAALRLARAGLKQAAVNDLIVALGRSGLDVVRLKGGDPYVFGRGGEEVLALVAAGVPYDVVPGVSSIAAVPAAAGIPVTQRGVSDRVTVVSGSSASDGGLDYPSLATCGGTIVVFMGLQRAGEVAAGLVGAGLSSSTPAAAISQATLPTQHVVLSTLAQLGAATDALARPALLVIGEVVALARAVPARRVAHVA